VVILARFLDRVTKELLPRLKKGYVANIEELTAGNTDFRRVLYTGPYSQLVLMCLQPREEIGAERHFDVDQFFRFEHGQGVVIINGISYPVGPGDCAVVPAGAEHNVKNTSGYDVLQLYTIYSPPNHKDNTVHHTKADTVHDRQFDGVTTE
jgi:mannose-6-phosphate isomerase-like protein (cupin superfamily)